MEIYKDSSNRKICFELPVLPEDNTVEVKLTKDGVTLHTFNTVEYEDGSYCVTIPFRFVEYETDYELEWKIDYVEDGLADMVIRKQPFSVVVPYLSLREVKKILGPDATDEEAQTVETVTRRIINAYTGQSFGYGLKTLKVEGHGESALRLPERLVELEGISTLTATLNAYRAIVVSDGWYLKKGWSDSVTAIESTDEYFLGENITNDVEIGEPGYEKPGHGYIITAPGVTGRATSWRDDYPFSITGWWGYKSVPGPVQEAAKLLINDYACGEVAYRDRYLESIKAADWRLQFAERSWDATGNVRADHLLAEFVLADWAVI